MLTMLRTCRTTIFRPTLFRCCSRHIRAKVNLRRRRRTSLLVGVVLHPQCVFTALLVLAPSLGTEMGEEVKPSMGITVGETIDPLVVDWGEWPQHSPDLNSTNPWEELLGDTENSSWLEGSTGDRKRLYHLVDECAQRLELRGVSCEEDEHKERDHRIPFMESGDLACGFQTRMTNGMFEDLASRLEFHFVGDSTTRRLAESFVSIVSGHAVNHEIYHENRNLFSGNLQVWFHWAPYCSALEDPWENPGVSMPFKDTMSTRERGEGRDGDKRTIFVTAFGVWDAEHGTGDAAAMSNCTDTVEWLVQADPYFGIGAEVANVSDASPPPVVFLLQNNPSLPGSAEDAFLDELHQIQREVVETHREESHAEVYLVQDRESLFESMMCYRIREEIHFYDPVKLVEGKMLWDLIALVGDGVAAVPAIPPP